jgi:hypothetical protein
MLAVMIGGQLGTHLGLTLLSERWIRVVTTILVL